jgi:hypothetical protein
MTQNELLTLAKREPARYRVYVLKDRLDAVEDITTRALWRRLGHDYWGRIY